MSRIDPRLHSLLGGSELAALRGRLRRHFERASPGGAPGPLRLGDLSLAEREALALLTGRPPRATRSMQIDVERLDVALCDAGIAGSLREALELLDGPIVNLGEARAAARAGWSAVLASCSHPWLALWLQAPAALGLLKRLARQDTSTAERLIQRADAVLRCLPAGGVARAQLAAQTLGNAHALDDGQPTATLVLAAWRQMEQPGAASATLAGSEDPIDRPFDPSSNERIRDIWARAGVLVNELARPALALNLPVRAGDAPLCAAGEPGYHSLRQLLRAPPAWAVRDRKIFVCENPNLVAIAADQLGARCAPLVCTDGMPAAAQRTLLTQLAHAGARLHYHGDFDWPGVQIANHVLRTWGAAPRSAQPWAAQPWRLSAQDYEAAAASAPHTQRDLSDACITATWDADLAPAMQHHGLAIAEEAVAASLLDDLSPP